MKKQLLQRENVTITEKADNWKHAIYLATNNLVKQGYVTSEYPKAIIELTKKYGPYYIITTDTALIHARPEDGVIDNQLAIVLLKNPVYFGEKKRVSARLLIALASKDSVSHLTSLQKIAEVLMDDKRLENILSIDNELDLYKVFQITKEEEK